MEGATIGHGLFASEQEAIDLASAAGLVPVPLDLTPSGEDHWHDFAATVYVVAGSLRVTVTETGEYVDLMAGSTIAAGPGTVHREEGDPYRAVVGFAEDPSNLTMPVDKPPASAPG
jgi:quercetin dioxygenase-like cupin family protein